MEIIEREVSDGCFCYLCHDSVFVIDDFTSSLLITQFFGLCQVSVKCVLLCGDCALRVKQEMEEVKKYGK